MNTNRYILAAVLCIIVCSCTAVPQSFAYNSSINATFTIPIIINSPEISIETGDDIENYTTISPSSNDNNTYEMVSTTMDGHPATTITAVDNPSADSSIVDKNDSFNLDITVLKGVYFCLKITNSSVIAKNNITITCSDPKGTYSYSSSSTGTHYIGCSNGALSEEDSISDGMWIYSETSDITIHLEGNRGSTLGQNWGGLKVTLVVKETS